jgi:DnaJ-class molecular chaperone
MNPYLELGVAENASDEDIRLAYLKGIQSRSPESDPEGFQTLHAAYERVQTSELRDMWRLFRNTAPGSSPLDALARHLIQPGVARPMPAAQFKQFLRLCAK